jgi:hypothetical protein
MSDEAEEEEPFRLTRDDLCTSVRQDYKCQRLADHSGPHAHVRDDDTWLVSWKDSDNGVRLKKLLEEYHG